MNAAIDGILVQGGAADAVVLAFSPYYSSTPVLFLLLLR